MDEIRRRSEYQPNTRRARNIIFFLGDGMGISTVTAGRIYRGQRRDGSSGEEGCLSWDRFPHVSLHKTYGLDAQTSDSANTATAYLCGVKANVKTIGVDSRIKAGECHTDKTTHVSSIMTWAQTEGLWTGLVTTTSVTHASPAGTYAHVGHRGWEGYVPNHCMVNDTKDSARQLVEESPGNEFRVILGGGRMNFINNTQNDEEGLKGNRRDGRNLIEQWMKSKEGKSNARYIWSKEQLLSVDPSTTDYLLGLLGSTRLPFVMEQDKNCSSYPTLQEMTEVAIKILQRGPKGFVLFVEGGLIDYAHHANRAAFALEETVGMDDAVISAMKLVDTKEALILVSADHSHAFTIGGKPERGKDILGIGGYSTDGYPITTLSYANGPGYNETKVNYTDAETTDPNFVQKATFRRYLATHGGEDIATYAIGPWSHLFSGVQDQTYIPYAISYAACFGQFAGSNCHTCKTSTG
ncbi:alkaline phosphatase-like [Ornithodoros turicata]|uniref:alkaline phosphatase-like n=1 Tax=Ornithodoros turicata TaxID=34597 RepID=UPI003138EE11